MRIIGSVQDGISFVGVLEGDQVKTLSATNDFYAHPDAVMAARSGAVPPLPEVTQVPFVPETADHGPHGRVVRLCAGHP